MSEPLITIAIATKNRLRFVKEVTDAIHRIDYPKKRVRLVFVDSSTDGTYEFLNDWATGHIQEYESVIVIKAPARGIPHARNMCLEHFKGDYILFIDSDVIAPPDTLNLLLEQFKESTVGIACIPYASTREDLTRPLQPAEVNISLGCTLIRGELISGIGKFDERVPLDDLWLYLKAKKLGYRAAVIRNQRCLHLRQWDYTKHLRERLVDTPQWHLFFFRKGLANSELRRRYLYYYGIIGSAMLAALTATFSPRNLYYTAFFLAALGLLLAYGIYHYRSLTRFFLYGLPTGTCLSLGLLIAILNPKNWRT